MATSNAQINISIALQDQINKGLESVTKGLDGLKSKAQSMQPTFQKMATVGTVAFGAIAAGVGLAVKEFQQAQIAEARLEQIARQVTKATDEQILKFQLLANSMEMVGVVGADVIMAGQSQVASFTKSAEVVTELSDDLADLAVAQYGVNVSQEQAIQTGNLLGKALQGQMGALTKAGILVSTEFEAAFNAANNEQERAIVLSQIIQDNYGGMNKALRDTSAGGIVALQNSIGHVVEQIGGAFIPIIDLLAAKIVPVLYAIGDWGAENPKLLATIIGVAAALSGLVAVAGAIGLVLPTIIAGFGFLATAITTVGAVMGGIGAIFAAAVGLIFTPIGLIVAGVAAFAVLIYKYWDEIKAYTIGAWQSTGEFLTGFFNGLFGFFTQVWENIKTIFMTGIALTLGLVLVALEYFGIDIGESFSNIAEVISIAWDFIKSVFTNSLEILKTLVTGYFGIYYNVITGVFNFLAKYMGGIWEYYKGIVTMGLDYIDKIIKDKSEPIVSGFTDVWSAVVGVVTRASETAKNIVGGLLNWVLDKINKVIDALNFLIEKGANKLPNVDIKRIPNIPQFAEGGIATKPTLGIFGEAGPEALIPLDKMDQMGGGTVINDFTGATFLGGQEVAEQIGDMIAKQALFNVKR